MITSVELGDFLSHGSTSLEFENGVTVFVGDNGAGKSSVIDAITFALFGQHTRKTNKSLIRRGASQGYAKVGFAAGGRNYEAVRKIDRKGALAATFSEVTGGESREIAAGERKQFGESMTREVEKVIGLDFEKLRIASIVQQGQLNAIIDARPKEFKELLNAIIGIDKLDVASETMKAASGEFRRGIRERTGYDDTHIDILSRDLKKHRDEVEEARPRREQLRSEQERLQEKVAGLQKKVDTETPKIDKLNQLEVRKGELAEYAKKAIREIQQEIGQNERRIRECRGCFEPASLREDLEAKIRKVDETVEDVLGRIQEAKGRMASLKERLLLASKLRLKDNKCPVCDSPVDRLNPLFEEEHLREEMAALEQEIAAREEERTAYAQKKKEFSEKLQNARDAQATLRAHSISTQEELEGIQKETEAKKRSIPQSAGSLLEMSQIDTHARAIFESISKLEAETRGFDEREFGALKQSVQQKRSELSGIDQQIGAVEAKIARGEKQISATQDSITELVTVREYVRRLDAIQAGVFGRDGPVATSLRSWALNTISAKASEYLALLDTKIQRILLSEKARDISIACYSKTEVLELESLSGGEKVSVALALRLGMASLLGASNLSLIILDEPTTHLDAERKRSLVGVLSQLSNISNAETPMQFLIITHDAEIFENSAVERIYRFESTRQGSKVTAI